jgi:hypothetical protein
MGYLKNEQNEEQTREDVKEMLSFLGQEWENHVKIVFLAILSNASSNLTIGSPNIAHFQNA